MTSSVRRSAAMVAAVLLAVALGTFYYYGATEHGERMNPVRGRADQSGYLWDAVAVHGNWQGNPPVLIGERNRMPLYPGLLALLYDPALTPDQFFERGKRMNIVLSMILLGILAMLFRRHLPPLPAVNLLLVIAFGYYIFKAGYVQTELLFYTLLFSTFLAFGHLLAAAPGRRQVVLGAAAGVLAALTHLSKAAVLPFVALFVGVYAITALAEALRGSGNRRRLAWRAGVLAAFLVAFLGALYPYISNSKRVFGHYFYNVNTTFYVWYDDWPSASIGTYQHGDGVGWPKMRARDLPSMKRYLREHSVKQIADRFIDGFRDMIVVNYQRFWIMKYLVFYLLFASVLALSQRQAFLGFAGRYPPVMGFLVLYAVLYLLAVAFYKPISGTTSRMFLAHVAPLLFSISWFTTREPFRSTSWRLAGAEVRTQHIHLLLFAMVLYDVAFMLWPRLFADFTGY